MTSRRDLERNPRFARLSPAPGILDTSAVSDLVGEDPGAALSLLADASGAVDPELRALARSLAARVAVRLGTTPAAHGRSGTGRLAASRGGIDGDVDLDASLDAVVEAIAARAPVSPDDLITRGWSRPMGATCVVVDRSGSMGGERLANAALAACVVATRAPADHAVLAFDGDVTVVKSMDEDRPIEQVVDDLLALRGHGPTDLVLALRAAREQLGRSAAPQKTVVLMSDCRHNGQGDLLEEARRLDRFVVVAPASDALDAHDFASSCGASVGEVEGPMQVPETLGRLLA